MIPKLAVQTQSQKIQQQNFFEFRWTTQNKFFWQLEADLMFSQFITSISTSTISSPIWVVFIMLRFTALVGINFLLKFRNSYDNCFLFLVLTILYPQNTNQNRQATSFSPTIQFGEPQIPLASQGSFETQNNNNFFSAFTTLLFIFWKVLNFTTVCDKMLFLALIMINVPGPRFGGDRF